MLASVDWTNVLVALIAGLPAIIGALYAGRIHRQIQTPSGTHIGTQVEDVNHTTRSNWHTIDAIRKDVGTELPSQAHEEAKQVDGINGN